MSDKEMAYLKALMKQTPFGHAILNDEFSLLWSNAGQLDWMQRLLGEAREFSRCFNTEAEFLAWREPATYSARRDGTDCRVVRLQTRDGSACWVELTLATTDIAPFWLLYLKDVTAWKLLETELDQRLESRSFLHQTVQELILRLDRDGKVVFVNQSSLPFVEIDSSFADCLEEACRNDWQEAWSRLITGENAPLNGVWKVSREGEAAMAIDWKIRRLLDPETDGFTGVSLVGRDLTAERRLDALCEQAGLTKRETELVELVAQGYTNVNIAAILGISESGVKYHLRNIFTKTKAGSRTELLSLVL